MEKSKKAFRLVAKRWRTHAEGSELFPTCGYFAIATNREGTPEERLAWYSQRGGSCEDRIGELKEGYAAGTLP